MVLISIFLAKYLIIIAAAYAVFHIYFLHEKRHHIQHVITVFASAGLALLVADVIKKIVAHPRPDLTHALLIPDDPYSFPSGHATVAFALATAMYAYDKKAGLILYVLAVCVGLGRVLVGVHYWYDIVGGAVVGYIVSLIAVALVKQFIKSR